MKRRLKKILLILTLTCFCFLSLFIMPVEKARANPALGLLAIPATAAAGPYIIAGLLVAGGAAVVVGASDAEIRDKALDIWNRTSDGFKQGVQDSINISGAAIDGTIEFTMEMKDELASFGSDVANWVKGLLSTKEVTDHGYPREFSPSYNSISGMYSIMANTSVAPNFRIGTTVGVTTGMSITLNNYKGLIQYSIVGMGGIKELPLTESFRQALLKYINDKTYSNYKAVWANIGIAFWPTVVDSVVPTSDVFDGNWTGNLAGVNEVAIPLDTWLAQAQTSTGQKVNIDTATGVMTLPDGTIYTGDVTFPWSIPKGKIGTFPDATLQNPSVPVDKVFEGDHVGTTPEEGTGEGGLLQGLWDWLKGILQSILNAIKALAGLLGILALIEAIKSIISSIAEGVGTVVESITTGLVGKAEDIKWEKLKMSGTYFTTKFPFSLPWDVGRALAAVFGDFFSDEVPSWTLKIKDWEQKITFPKVMVNWMPYLKTMILVMFDITLIYSVRKLLGGAQ